MHTLPPAMILLLPSYQFPSASLAPSRPDPAWTYVATAALGCSTFCKTRKAMHYCLCRFGTPFSVVYFNIGYALRTLYMDGTVMSIVVLHDIDDIFRVSSTTG